MIKILHRLGFAEARAWSKPQVDPQNRQAHCESSPNGFGIGSGELLCEAVGPIKQQPWFSLILLFPGIVSRGATNGRQTTVDGPPDRRQIHLKVLVGWQHCACLSSIRQGKSGGIAVAPQQAYWPKLRR